MNGSDIYVNQDVYVDGDPKPSGAFIGQKLKATNGKVWEWPGAEPWNLIVDVTSDGSNTGLVSHPDAFAHESGAGTSAQTGIGIPKSNGGPADVSVNSTDVSIGPAFLLGIYVNTTIAVEAVGIHNGAGGEEKMTLPIGLVAGTYIPCNGRKFSVGIFVESTNATGSITVDWWAQP